MIDFCHLHRHGEFSRLDGIGTAKEYAQRAAEIGQGVLAQTDHGTLSGALHHIAACREAGIVPIVGVEAYYRPDRSSRMTRQAWHLILLAKNLKGWHNLLRMCSIAYGDQKEGGGFYQVPCIDDDLLDRFHEGLICTSACFQSWLANLIRSEDSVAARDYITRMKSRFGDDFWLEIMPHDFDDQRMLNIEIVRLADETSTGVIATNDTHFVFPEWAETQRVAKMMATKLSFHKVEEMIEKGEEPPYTSELCPTLYLARREEVKYWFADNHPHIPMETVMEAIGNTMELASTIRPFMLDKTIKMPKVTDHAYQAEGILLEWVTKGLERIRSEYPSSHWEKWSDKNYVERVEFELGVLKDMNVIPYMVMVGDIVRWCKGQGIRVGLGRGSAAGCLISYLVGITAIDPIAWGLLFERFLNPGRKGLPDIDIDVQADRRGEVKAYIIEKYGAEHVADIITHERFQPKSVLQRICTVFDVPYMEAKGVTDTIDIRQDDEDTTLEELLPLNDKLKEFKLKYPQVWEHATRLEGQVANIGKHASGIVVTPEPIIDYMALERGKKGDLVTSWSDSADFMVISDYGFMKLDLLGLKELRRHDYACKLIEKRHGKRIDLNNLPPLRDPTDIEPQVLQLFADGYTMGLFQFSGSGITRLIRSIEPETALDLSAANALYRPGAMKDGMTWDYPKFKNGEKEPEEIHPLLLETLRETYGLVAYQEQTMEIAKRLAGFTPAQADDLRKAMGKLYRIKGGRAAKDFMSQYEQLWRDGTKENGIPKAIADRGWKTILSRGSYSFNKSHSASYGLSAYQDAWLKEHYSLEMYAAILTYPSGSTPRDKQEFISGVVREAKARGIEFLPPDINKSALGWSIDDDKLRFGLLSIKDVGDVAAGKIILKRRFGFFSIDDVRQRCGSKVNKKVIEALTESGAFDCFGARDGVSGKQIAIWEKDRLKMTIVGVSDADRYSNLIERNIYSQEEVAEVPKGTEVIIGGEILRVEKKKTVKQRPFANVTISFGMNEWRAKFWEEKLLLYEDILLEGNVIMISGKKDEWNGYVSVVAQNATDVEKLAEQTEEVVA